MAPKCLYSPSIYCALNEEHPPWNVPSIFVTWPVFFFAKIINTSCILNTIIPYMCMLMQHTLHAKKTSSWILASGAIPEIQVEIPSDVIYVSLLREISFYSSRINSDMIERKISSHLGELQLVSQTLRWPPFKFKATFSLRVLGWCSCRELHPNLNSGYVNN